MNDERTQPSLSDVRHGIRSSQDARAIRTRERILAAVETLAVSGAEITVSALVREAGVSRATFYTHFGDLGELALRVQEDAFDRIARQEIEEERLGRLTAMRASQERLVRHYGERRALYAAVFSLPASSGVHARVTELMARDIRSHVEREGVLPHGLDAGLSARYIAAAAVGLISSWVVGDVDADERTIVTHLVELMPRWMYRDETTSAGDAGGMSSEGK